MNFKFSNQAVGAIMMALQKGIMEQVDITGMLKEFEIIDSADGLIINNPPVINLEENKTKTTTKKVRKKRTTKKRATAKKKKEDA
jgi:hypothetical protein